MGEPAYRARQIYRGLYREGLTETAKIRTLPASLRKALTAQFEVGLPEVDRQIGATDGTVRYLLGLTDRRSVEAVYLPDPTRDTLCISTQVGCPIDCKFCFTALMGLERNLSAGEIVGQVLTLARERGLDPRRRPINVVMMGMGEPLLNLAEVMKASRLLADREGVGIPMRRITVSTAGITPKIKEFAREPQRPELAVSLNASTQEMRERLMPVTQKYSLAELIELCRRYPLRPRERLTFEYVLLKTVNDSEADARRVVRLLANIRCKVNLIPFNPGPGIDFETPSPERILAFQSIIRAGIPCYVRKPRGREIQAACGQLKRSEVSSDTSTTRI